MNTKHSLSDLERYSDGECLPEEAAEIRAALDRDPALVSELYKLQEVDRLVRSISQEIKAPETLRRSVEDRYGLNDEPQPAEPGKSVPVRLLSVTKRRGFLIGAGSVLAASMATFAVIPTLKPKGGAALDPVGTLFRDFETYLAGDKSVDVTEANMVRLAEWFSGRLSFSLPPISSSGAGARLVGGRLCWLLERRLASLSYDTDEGPLVVYVMSAAGINVPAGRETSEIGRDLSWHRSSGSTSLMWKSGDLLLVMVGTQEVRKLMSIARSLVG